MRTPHSTEQHARNPARRRGPGRPRTLPQGKSNCVRERLLRSFKLCKDMCDVRRVFTQADSVRATSESASVRHGGPDLDTACVMASSAEGADIRREAQFTQNSRRAIYLVLVLQHFECETEEVFDDFANKLKYVLESKCPAGVRPGEYSSYHFQFSNPHAHLTRRKRACARWPQS